MQGGHTRLFWVDAQRLNRATKKTGKLSRALNDGIGMTIREERDVVVDGNTSDMGPAIEEDGG